MGSGKRTLGLLAMAGATVAFAATGAGSASVRGPTSATPRPVGWGVKPDGMNAAAHSELKWSKPVAPGVTRYKYRYGPLIASAGSNLILFGPVTIERPPGNGYGIRFKPDLEDPQGHVPPIEQVHTHHGLLLTLSRFDITAPSIPQRFSAWAEEKTIGSLPSPYGYYIGGGDKWAINYMLHNETAQSRELYITYEVDWVPASSARGRKMKPVQPLWMDVQNGKAYPVFDVERQFGDATGRFTYPDQARTNPYGKGPQLNRWTVNHDGTLVATVGHVHPGGLYTDLNLTRGGKTVRLFRSRAKYFDPNGPVSWDMAMTYTPVDWRVAVRKGDVLSVHATYDTTHLSAYEAMGLMVPYIAYGDRTGLNPFTHKIKTTGKITHGHYHAADNHGGKATSLPDPRKLPAGANAQDGVAVANWTYIPGDLGLTNGLGNPPVVKVGDQLTFLNVDEAGQVFHTITSCKAPCNGSTGISYPLPNGPVDFDSGELGFGPTGYSAATNKDAWTTPSNLPPGTYTYFCRVHPFMRGAFRVPGTPQVPGASTLRIASKRAKVGPKGRAHVKLACAGDGGGCAGKLSLVKAHKGRAETIGSHPYSLRGGSTRAIVVQLSTKVRDQLRAKHTMTVTAAAAGPTTVTRTLTLEWAGE
jgi:plastocyanin